MRAFVVGGRGHVGSLVAAGLAEKGADVRVLTRDAAKAGTLPPGQTAVTGTIDSISVLKEEMSAADAVFLMFPPQDTLCFSGLNAVALAAEGRPDNVVMMTAIDVDGPLVGVGHCGGLLPAELALARTDLSYTILRPNYFFQNDERQRGNIEKGVYGSPIGDVGLSRVDVRDIADAALASFETGGTGERHVVCGPEVFTGTSTAAVWSDVLGRQVDYAGHDDMAAFERYYVEAGLPEHWAYDLCKMYEVWQRVGAINSDEQVERVSRLIGHEPRRFRTFAEELAEQWSRDTEPYVVSWGQ